MHPYELQQLTTARGKDLFAEHRPGSLYSVIDRLHADGLIEATGVSRSGRLPERTVYRITAHGSAALVGWLRAELGELDERDLPRFAFAVEKLVHLAPDVAVELFERRAAATEAQLAGFDEIKRSAACRDVPAVALLEVGYACAVRVAELAWLRRALADVAGGRLTWQPMDHEEEP